MLYAQLLSTPFKDVGNYWDPYMAFASQQTVEVLGSDEEVSTLVSAYDADARNKMSGGCWMCSRQRATKTDR